MLNDEKCYRLTLLLDASTSSGGDAPIQVVVQSVCQDYCYTAQITYEQASLLLVKILHEPPLIREHMDAFVKYELVEIHTAGDKPSLFSADELADVGILLDFKRAS